MIEKLWSVDGLEAHIKKEKEESNEVAKYSQRRLNKIKDNAETLEILIRALKVSYLTEIWIHFETFNPNPKLKHLYQNYTFQSNLQRESSSVNKLSDKAVDLQKGVAMAQRTNDTHAALQEKLKYNLKVWLVYLSIGSKIYWSSSISSP